MRLLLGLAAVLATAGAASGQSTEYRIELGPVASLEVGQPGSQTLTLTPLRGRRISRDGPLLIDVVVDPAEGLKLTRTRLRLRDAVDPEAHAPRFEIPLVGERPGSYQLELDIRFWICARRTCRPVRERRRAPVEVVGPKAPVDAGPDGPPEQDAS